MNATFISISKEESESQHNQEWSKDADENDLGPLNGSIDLCQGQRLNARCLEDTGFEQADLLLVPITPIHDGQPRQPKAD
jgi:hypothetical protein